MGRSCFKKNTLGQLKPSVFASERMKIQGFMKNKHLFALEKERESMFRPPLKVQTASVSSQTDEFIPKTIFNRNELNMRLSSNTDSCLDDNTFDRDRQVEEISVCTSHLCLDLKNEEESKRSPNVLHPGREQEEYQREKSKHKNRRKRSLKHDDCILKDINGTLKHYNSLCSTYLFKTRNSNLFVKNEFKQYSESNVQKIANGVKTCILQSYPISEPGKIHFTTPVLIEEETYIPPSERRSLAHSCILKSSIVSEPNSNSLSFIKPDTQNPRIRENYQRDFVGGLVEEDTMAQQMAPLVRYTASSRTRKKKRNVKKISKALESYRSEQDGSYSTEDTDTEVPPRNGLRLQKVHNTKKSFEFAENRTGWVSSESEENSYSKERKHSADVYIRPSSFTSLDYDDDERYTQLPFDDLGTQQQRNERYFEGQEKEDGLIEEGKPNKRNRSSARKTSPLKAKKRKKVIKKIPKASQLFISKPDDFTDDTDTKGSPQMKISPQKSQNQSLNYDKQTSKKKRNEGTADDIEQDYIYDDEEMLNTELCSSESSLFNFSSENYNLQFPKCSSFVLIMGNQLGRHSGISSSMETLCSTETSRNEIAHELSQKMEGFSLSDQNGQDDTAKGDPSRMEQGEESVQDNQKANAPPINDFRSDHGNQVAVEEDGNSVKSDQVLKFAVGDLKLDFTPSLQLKARKIVYKKNRNVRRLLFRSNKGALYLKTFI